MWPGAPVAQQGIGQLSSLELNYSQQNEDVDMIPLMMADKYTPKVS